MIDKQNQNQVKNNILFLTFIFIIALLFRITWALLAASVDPFLNSNPLLGDAASYYRIAMNLLDGNGFSQYSRVPSSFWPPLYPFSLYIIFASISKDLTTIRIIQAFWGTITPMVFAWIALKNFGKKEGYIVGIGLAIYPYLIYFGAWLIAEALFMMLFSITLFSAFRFAIGKNYRWIVIMGFFLGLSILTKPSALFYTPFIAIWVMLAPIGLSILLRIKFALVLTLITLIVVLPWSIRNYIVFDRFTLVASNSGYTLLGANNPNAWGGHNEGFPSLIPGVSESEMDGIFFSEAWNWIKSNPAAFIRLGIIKIQRLISPLSVASQPQDYSIPGADLIYLTYRAFLVSALCGMIIGIQYIRRIGYLYAPVIGVLLSAFIFYGDTRYTLPMVPSLIVFSVVSIMSGFTWIKKRIQPRLI